MVGVNIIALGSEDEARRLATTQQCPFTNLFRGARGLSKPLIDDIESYWSPYEKAQALTASPASDWDVVCENHPKRAWSDELVCQCGAGMPCECISADGLEEPDVSQVLEAPSTRH